MHVLYGEATTKTIVPPDYVTLQSNMLFARKTDVKNLIMLVYCAYGYGCEIDCDDGQSECA